MQRLPPELIERILLAGAGRSRMYELDVAEEIRRRNLYRGALLVSRSWNEVAQEMLLDSVVLRTSRQAEALTSCTRGASICKISFVNEDRLLDADRPAMQRVASFIFEHCSNLIEIRGVRWDELVFCTLPHSCQSVVVQLKNTTPSLPFAATNWLRRYVNSIESLSITASGHSSYVLLGYSGLLGYGGALRPIVALSRLRLGNEGASVSLGHITQNFKTTVPTLRELEIWPWRWSERTATKRSTAQIVLTQCPQLETLTIGLVRDFTTSMGLHIDDLVAASPSTLRTLALNAIVLTRAQLDAVAVRFDLAMTSPDRLPNLEHLSFRCPNDSIPFTALRDACDSRGVKFSVEAL